MVQLKADMPQSECSLLVSKWLALRSDDSIRELVRAIRRAS